MPKLGIPGTLMLLLLGGGMLALTAGQGRIAQVAAPAAPQADPAVPNVTVYVSDFELRFVGPPAPEKKERAAGTATGAKSIDSALAAADTPGLQAQVLTDWFAETLVQTLRKNGLSANRVKDSPGGSGVLLRGVFAETDAKNRVRRAVLGAGSTNPEFLLYVGTFNLKSPDQPLYEPAAVQEADRRYGPVITLNAYIPLQKFEVAKNPTEEDLQRVCGQIAQNLKRLLAVNKEAFAH